MPSDSYLRARELVGEAYERLIIARHYAGFVPIRTAEQVVLQTLIALYDVDVEAVWTDAQDMAEEEQLPF